MAHEKSRTVTLAIAIIVDPPNIENEELQDWISFSQVLLKDLGTCNAVAAVALQHIDVIRKRTDFVLNMSRGNNAASLDIIAPSLHDIERATRVLSQPQPCMTDLLGHELVMDTYWTIIQPGAFGGHFPGIESLSGPLDSTNLERFLDSCMTMQSKAPPIFTV